MAKVKWYVYLFADGYRAEYRGKADQDDLSIEKMRHGAIIKTWEE